MSQPRASYAAFTFGLRHGWTYFLRTLPDRGENVFLVLLDLSAAFDTVNHSRLLSRLQDTFGIQGTVLKWFKSYLTNRSQFVNINDSNSSVRELTVGICFILHHLLMSYDRMVSTTTCMLMTIN